MVALKPREQMTDRNGTVFPFESPLVKGEAGGCVFLPTRPSVPNHFFIRFLCLYLIIPMLTASLSAASPTLSIPCRFDLPQLTLTSGAYVHVAVPGCSTLQRRGMPQMPFRTVQVPLPPCARVTGVFVRAAAAPVVLDGTWEIDYGRTPLPLRHRVSVTQADSDAPDAAVYTSHARHPAQQAELVSVQREAGNDYAVIRVFPLQFAPAAGRLVFSPSLDITIFIETPATLTKQASSPAAKTATGYLLVTSSNLLASFQPLLDFHAARGLTVHSETMETVVSNYAGRDAAEKLRNYIRFAYTNWALTCVLLGGDISVIPCRGVYARCGTTINNSMPSDLYFACLDGSWNSDNDSLWAEPTDGEGGGDVDLLAEIFVGRAPVESVAEATRFVDKTILFSTTAWNRLSACIAGEHLDPAKGSLPQGGDALDRELPAFTNSHRVAGWLDDRPAETETWWASNAIAALNLAPPLVAHYGHADDATVMRLSVQHLDVLSNECPFLLYSTGCDAGWFDNSWLLDCIGEVLIVSNRHAAVAALLNAREGWYDPVQEWLYSGEFQQHFFDGLLLSNRTALGAAHQLAKHEMIGTVETNGINMTYRWCYFGINLLGDPALIIESPVLPFVDMTNGPIQALFTEPFSVAGTNNTAVCGNLWIVNATNNQSTSFPAAISWTSTAITIALGPNHITVFGTNFIGEVSSDSIEVVGVPEGVGGCCIGLFLVLAFRKPSVYTGS